MDNKIIKYLTIFNYGYAEFAMNNVLNYLQVIKSDNTRLVLTALDIQAYTVVEHFLSTLSDTYDISSIELKTDVLDHVNFAEFNTPAFIDIMHKKIHVIYNELLDSEIIHFFDGDVVFFKNPSELIRQSLIDYDIVFQQDAPVVHHDNRYHNYVCAGNFSIKNSEAAIQFIKEVISRLSPGQNDQETMYGYLNSICNNIKDYPYCKLDAYDQSLFQNGFDAFKENWYMNPNKISIHANHMVGMENKMNSIKQANAWFLN